jgi:hypothetical protein
MIIPWIQQYENNPLHLLLSENVLPENRHNGNTVFSYNIVSFRGDFGGTKPH